MSVDVRSGGKVAMAHPFLDLLHRDAVCQKNRGTAVTEVMESYHPQSATFQKFGESGCNIRRACPYPKLVHTDVIQIVRTVRFSTKPPQFFLFCLLPQWFCLLRPAAAAHRRRQRLLRLPLRRKLQQRQRKRHRLYFDRMDRYRFVLRHVRHYL